MGAGTLSLPVYLVCTHYLYYQRPGQHMAVPRKIPVHIQERNTSFYNTASIINVGTVHKPRQGGINSVPL